MTQGIDERKFWNWVFSNGLVPGQVFGELGTDSLAACTLDKAEIMAKLAALVESLRGELPEGWDLVKGEAYALAIVWGDVYAPGGAKLSLTARHGATVEDIMATALAWQQAAGGLRALGWGVGSRSPKPPPKKAPAKKAPTKSPKKAETPATSSAKKAEGKKPPAQSGDAVYLIIEHIRKDVTNDKTSYRVFGPPRFRRYGVRVWPEVAAVLAQFGMDLDAMTPGEKMDAASLGLKGEVLFTEEGKASKITTILPV